jgi:hypothetical protein
MGRLMMVHPPILVRPTWFLVVAFAPRFTWFLSRYVTVSEVKRLQIYSGYML